MCMLRDCSVCECSEQDIPATWRAPPTPESGAQRALEQCAELPGEGVESGRVNREMELDGSAFATWREIDNPWTAEDEASADLTCASPCAAGAPRRGLSRGLSAGPGRGSGA